MEPELQGYHPKHTEQNQNMQKTESAENFQKFIYDLFDKNGILNDLRAYLRGHIIDVLKGAQTGDPPSCQKNFTQRLDSTLQALNILVAECLLCLEFNYSLSVFLSEIPLANMVFAFAKSLMDLGADGEATGLRFSEKDVWAILNCLGMKCDSEHVNKVYEMYKKQQKSPLLLCILKCSQLCKMEENDAGRVSDSSISDSSKSFLKRSASRCKHRAFCKACRRRYRHLQDKYRTKKAHIIQKAQANTNLWNVETIVKNIGELERTLVDEMFEQLKSVYETEMEMFKAEHEGKIKNSLDSHMQHFQQMKNELEESYKAREAALKANVMQKKRFLWELAQALRAQHTQMAKAMQAVRRQTAEIAVQEQNLKLQRTQAEESLKQRAEEMRQQIADELLLLEGRLESMKTEREGIIRERATDSETKVNMEIKNYLQNHYHLWKEELNVLKMYIENASFQPKSVIERSTITDDGFKGMNNERGGLVREGRPNQVVNNLKKQKNVNFNQGKSESASRSDRSTSSDDDLRHRTQPVQVSLATPLQQAPAVHAPRMEHSTLETECGWQKGAGEERSLLPRAQILVPGDTLPFVGVVGRRSDGRRHLLSRWRVLRRRASPPAPRAPPSPPADPPAESMEIRTHSPSTKPARENEEMEEDVNDSDNLRFEPNAAMESPKTKSPRSVLKEAKEKLKTVTRASALRESSPSALLREAKLRLRKLEIEAEAVERSYQDFRKRQERKEDLEPTCVLPTTASKLSMHHTEAPEHSKSQVRATDSMHLNLEKYLNKYQINLNVGDHFKSKNITAQQQKPIPDTYSEINRNFAPIPKQDFLEKPITEFRKLYYTNQERSHPSNQMSQNVQESQSLGKSTEQILKEKCSELRKEKDTKRKEIEILKENITKIYNLQDDIKETNEVHSEDNIADNLLIVEVENITETRGLNMQSESDMVLVVESSVDSKDIVVSEYGDSMEDMLTKMTIVISPKQNDPSDIVIERKEITTQRARTPSPKIRQLSPRVRPQSPRVRPQSPRVRTPSPPVGQQSAHVRQPSPQVRQLAPQVGQLSPQVGQLSPQVRQLSPRVRPQSPRVRTPSPPVGQQSAHVRQPSPQVRQLAPQVGQLSPQVGQLSPHVRQLSPRVRPQSPRVRTPSPPVGQQSPHDRQPLPQVRQLSPQVRPQSPRVRPQPLFRTQSDATHNMINKITEFLEAGGDKDSEEDLHLELRDEPDSEIQIRQNAPSGTGEAADDYPDDFSYDVDNYKSGEHSPISLAKTSEDENFWD